MNENVLIVGGTGFVGYWMMRTRPTWAHPYILNSENYLEDYWRSRSWDHIVSLAPIPQQDIIMAAYRSKSSVLYASSGAVYDKMLTSYGELKLASEFSWLDSELNVKIARLFTFCGKRLKWESSCIGQFIMAAENGRPIHVMGDGSVTRSYMYGSDLGLAMWLLLEKGVHQQIYDVGSSREITIKTLAKEVASNFCPSPEIYIDNQPIYEPRPHYVPDLGNLHKLGWKASFTFEDAIRQSVVDYENE